MNAPCLGPRPKVLSHVLSMAGLLAGLPAALHAQPVPQGATLAATCAACHGTGGRAVQASTIPSLAGRPREWIVQQMLAFRDGSHPATVMHQIAKGYSREQIEQVSDWFAARHEDMRRP